MIGLLEDKLSQKGINKKVMCKSLLSLIDGNRFHEQLGENGPYLMFKCLSTCPQGTGTPP